MNRKIILLVGLLLLIFSMTACGSNGPEMPMEITVDGYDIVLGQTTMQDMIDLGYEVHTDATPNSINNDAKYVPFYFSLDKGAGHQIHVTVLVPWSGSKDVSEERSLAQKEGVIQIVKVTLEGTKKVDVVYNGVNTKDLSFTYAADEWGCKLKEGTDGNSSKTTYTLAAKNGGIELQGAYTTSKEYDSLRVYLSEKAFENMHK